MWWAQAIGVWCVSVWLALGKPKRLVLAELCCRLAWLKAVRGISGGSEWLSLSETLSTREAE